MFEVEFRQTLYWVNVPGVTDNLDWLGHFIPDYLNCLIESGNPTLIYTGIKNIDFNLYTKDWPDSTWEELKTKDIDIFLYEPVTWYQPAQEYNCGHYHEVVSSLNSNLYVRELDSIQEWFSYRQICGRIITADFDIRQHTEINYPKLNPFLYTYDIYLRQIAGPGGIQRLHTNNFDTKFYCANRRYAPHRHIIAAFLANKNTNLSWPFQCNFVLKKHAWFEMKTLPGFRQEELMLGNQKLATQLHEIDLHVPSFRANTVIQNMGCAGQNGPLLSQDNTHEFIEKYSKSCIAIVNETRYGQPTAYFSEKTMDAIKLRVPFVLVAPPHTLRYMRSLGFLTFESLWSEYYDEVEDHMKRLEEIFNVIDYLDNLPFEELEIMHGRAEKILEHNKRVVKDMCKTSLDDDLLF